MHFRKRVFTSLLYQSITVTISHLNSEYNHEIKRLNTMNTMILWAKTSDTNIYSSESNQVFPTIIYWSRHSLHVCSFLYKNHHERLSLSLIINSFKESNFCFSEGQTTVDSAGNQPSAFSSFIISLLQWFICFSFRWTWVCCFLKINRIFKVQHIWRWEQGLGRVVFGS